MNLSEILIITFCLLFLAMVTASISRYLEVPYTVMLVVLGILIKASEPYIPFFSVLNNFQITSELVIFVFLPALVFEASLKIDARALLKNILPVLILAIPGMFISMLMVGIGLWFTIEINIFVALLFGALISATDPVAVVAIFKELGISKRLTLLVEGESLFNDATAIVLFNIILALLLTSQVSYQDLMPAIPEFFRVFLGGIAVGVLVAVPISELMVRLFHDDSGIPVILSLVIAYFSFIIAEHAFHVSGVMSVLTAAISLNAAGLMRLSSETMDTVYGTWKVVVLIFNSLLFILIGLSVNWLTLADYWQAIVCAVLAVAIARAIGVYLILPLTTMLFKLPKIGINGQHIMWWGGLKGGLAIAIVLSVPDSLPEKQLLFELTLGVVLVSLLLNASTIRYLIRWKRIDNLADEEKAELKQNLERVQSSVEDVLHQFSSMHLLGREMEHSVGHALNKDLMAGEQALTESQRLELVRLNALQGEMDELKLLHDVGMLNYYTYLTFRDLLYKDKGNHFSGQQSVQKNDPAKKNIFIRLEWQIIDFLSQHNWTQRMLIKYQELRFSNRIQHDIAGVLLAHAGLKVIKQNENYLKTDECRQMRKVYQDRLVSRQLRLHEFAERYTDFYHQFEYLLFQKVALKYALKLINSEHEAGKIGTKVYSRIYKRLHYALKRLPVIKTVLSLNRRNDWITKVPLFNGLPEQDLKKLASNAQYINFLSGDTIFNEGDKGHSVYVLVSGRLNVFKRDPSGSSQHIAELREGCVVGEHALINNVRRSATVKAKTYVTLLRMTVADIAELAKVLPELQNRLRAIDAERMREDENFFGKSREVRRE